MLEITFLCSDSKGRYYYKTDFYEIEPKILYSTILRNDKQIMHDWYVTCYGLMSIAKL